MYRNKTKRKSMEKRNDSIYKCISNSRYTPYLLAKKIGAIGILESASFQKGRERYSILMTEIAFKTIQNQDEIYFEVEGKKSLLTKKILKAKML